MSFFSTVRNYYDFTRCIYSYLRDARHLTFEEAHARRAACTQSMLDAWNVTYDIENREGLTARRPCIYVANHSAMIDPIVLCSVFPYDVRFLAKREAFRVPLLRDALNLERHIPVYRGAQARAHLDELKTAVSTAISEGACCLFFPEGTRTRDGRMGEFKLGAFFNAVQNHVPIVPIALEGMFRLNPRSQKGVTPGHAVIHVLDSIDPPEGDDERECAQKLANLAHDAIASKLASCGQS
ncbi:MAG: 1-acyl-sn-glycerol-3-phosphate acyltransferase [Proteobacteria bacterium]|nr:1-acyl-sn-glycerol-3-phosphate acyltransferase [Pseudomonadota bacterium]